VGGDFGGSVAGGGGSPTGWRFGRRKSYRRLRPFITRLRRFINLRRRFVHQYGFAVTEMLFGQRQPGVGEGDPRCQYQARVTFARLAVNPLGRSYWTPDNWPAVQGNAKKVTAHRFGNGAKEPDLG
jgi:hypothetical protein